MPISKLFIGTVSLLALLASIAVVSGLRIESVAVILLVLLALCGGGFTLWLRYKCNASIGLSRHLAGWVVPLVGAAAIYAWFP